MAGRKWIQQCPYNQRYCDGQDPKGTQMCLLCLKDHDKTKENDNVGS